MGNRLGKKLYQPSPETDPHYLMFHCPGCECLHAVGVGPVGWGYNGNPDAPTFTPSVLVTGGGPRCHSFVTDGRIAFLMDSTHALAGQTVEIPDWD